MTATLYGLSYSPWSERARWALDHHRVPYRWVSHQLYVGELALRRRARVRRGERASVPLFVDGDLVLRDSMDIIRHADRVGHGATLVTDEAATAELVAVTETGLRALRGRVTAGVLASAAAMREQAMDVVPGFLAPLLAPIVVRGARFIAGKYGANVERDGANLDAIRTTLEALRDRVDTSSVPGPDGLRVEHVLLATFLQGIRPVEARHIPLRPVTREVWTCTPLLPEAEPLLRWRDALYAAAR